MGIFFLPDPRLRAMKLGMQVKMQWHGLTTFQDGIRLQWTAFVSAKASAHHFILGMEHPEVLTLGLRSHHDPLLEFYRQTFPEVVPIKRGGHLVVHNPGQLVIYPVLNLYNFNWGVRDYVQYLLKVTQAFLLNLGIETYEKLEPGLYTTRGKIAMFGVGIRHGVTQHGLCVNVNNDLSVFSKVSLCNVTGESLDKIAYHRPDLSTKDLFRLWTEQFTLGLNEI